MLIKFSRVVVSFLEFALGILVAQRFLLLEGGEVDFPLTRSDLRERVPRYRFVC